jgi:hypothetical protein
MNDFATWWKKVNKKSARYATEEDIANAGWEAASTYYEEKLHRLREWAKAYPLKTFPEPDFKKSS